MGMVGFAFVLAAFREKSADLFWHLKTGEWIIDNLAVPKVDFFSFSRESMEWIDAQWLFQVLLASMYLVIGETAFTVFKVIFTPLIVVLIIFSVSGKTPLSVRAMAGLSFLLALNVRIYCRPELLTYFYMASMFFVLERAGKGQTRLLFIIPAIQLLFANSQGLWPIGIALVGAYAGDGLLDIIKGSDPSRRTRLLMPWLMVLIGVFLVSFLQPYGLKGLFSLFSLLKKFWSAVPLKRSGFPNSCHC